MILRINNLWFNIILRQDRTVEITSGLGLDPSWKWYETTVTALLQRSRPVKLGFTHYHPQGRGFTADYICFYVIGLEILFLGDPREDPWGSFWQNWYFLWLLSTFSSQMPHITWWSIINHCNQHYNPSGLKRWNRIVLKSRIMSRDPYVGILVRILEDPFDKIWLFWWFLSSFSSHMLHITGWYIINKRNQHYTSSGLKRRNSIFLKPRFKSRDPFSWGSCEDPWGSFDFLNDFWASFPHKFPYNVIVHYQPFYWLLWLQYHTI